MWEFHVMSLLLVLCEATHSTHGPSLSTDRLRQHVVGIVDTLWRDLSESQRYAVLLSRGVDREIVRRFSVLKSHFRSLDQQAQNSNLDQLLYELQYKLPDDQGSEWVQKWALLESKIGAINELYNWFDDRNMAEQRTLQDYAETVMDDDGKSSMTRLLASLHNLTAPSGEPTRKGIFSDLKSVLQSGTYKCDLPQSPHQVMYNLYNLISLTEIKGYTMMQFSWMLLKLYKKGNFTVEVQLAQRNFEERAQQKLKALQSILPEMSTEFWRCDPSKHKEGETYVRLTQFLQGYIENEVDLNSAATCNYNCPYYSYVASSAGCYQNMFCSKQRRCKGRIFNCDFKDADSWVCMSDDPDRRYDWIEYENGMVFGKKAHCSNKIKVDSWWRWVFWHCSYCFCICDEIVPNSDRYFSLRAVRADVGNNKIVTGLRFIKHNRIIHIQIQEGKALPEGIINESSVAWKPVEDLKPENTNGNDIMMLSWEERAIDTDDLHAPKNHVVTGVKFRNVGGHLNLELEVTPINFATGEISPLQSIWIGNDNTPASLSNPRTKLQFTYPDIPTQSPLRSEPDTQHDQYVEFMWTSATSDVSQTTIPFMDAQPVSPEPHTWLTGAGVFHKGQSGYGGFMALKVNTMEFTPYLAISEFKPGNLGRNSLHGTDKETADV